MRIKKIILTNSSNKRGEHLFFKCTEFSTKHKYRHKNDQKKENKL